MKLISNLLKLSLAPFGLVLGLSEVPLGIRNGFIVPNSFDPFRRKEFRLKFSREGYFYVGFDVFLLSTEFQTEPLIALCYLLSNYSRTNTWSRLVWVWCSTICNNIRWPGVPFKTQSKEAKRQTYTKNNLFSWISNETHSFEDLIWFVRAKNETMIKSSNLLRNMSRDVRCFDSETDWTGWKRIRIWWRSHFNFRRGFLFIKWWRN